MKDILFPPPAPVLVPTTDGRAFPVRRLFCVGRNYAAHAREMGSDPDRMPPFFFTKWAEVVVPSGSVIAYPQATNDYHYEAELVVAIGKGGRDISAGDALDHVYGYATGLDMTRRDLQGVAKDRGQPWDWGKNVEQSAPLGPIHPAHASGHIARGRIALTLNGETKQDANIADMIWPVPNIIAFLSTAYRVEPGDLVYTGTPAGVGAVRTGDRIVVSIDGLSDTIVDIGPPARD